VDLAGRVVLVTGAGRRLGRAMASALAGRGMTVAIHYHESQVGAEALRREIEGRGGQAACFAADLADAAAARALPGRVVDELGRLDVLVNSAAVMHQVRSVFFVTQGAAAALRATRGKVVNIADLGGLEPWPGYAAHSVSKAGVVMLTKVLALSLAPDVTVNAIAPGAVLVPEAYDEAERERLAATTPARRLGSADDVVGALLYLLEGGDYVTGEVLAVDGGRRLR
jgi:pteridine reductase